MSQIFKPSTGGTPVIPPDVPEVFQTDVNSPAIPAANILKVFGGQTSINNLLGVQTDGSSGSNTLTVQLTNRLQGAISTIDATPTTIITFALGATPAVFTLDGFISALNNTVASGAGYFFSAAVRTNGAAAIDLGHEFTSVFQEVAMSTAAVAVGVSGNNLVITVTGIAATAIDWLSQATYSRVI